MYKVLWIPSWYPTIDSEQNGDFIFRHAQAVSIFLKFDLLFCYSSASLKVRMKEIEMAKSSPYCKTKIISFRGNRIFKYINSLRYIFYYYKGFKSLYFNQRKPDLLHVHVSFRAGVIALLIKFFYGIPYVTTEHWTLFTKERYKEYKRKSWLFKLIIKAIFSNAAYVLPVSKDLEKNLRSHFFNIKTVIIPNLVDNKQFFFATPKVEVGFGFVHVSSGRPSKNVDKIVNSFLRLRMSKANYKASLTVIGCDLIGKYEPEYLRAMGVRLIGPLQHDTVATSMRAMHCFVLFSDYETQSCVSIEALCCGLPVISSRLPCIEEFITEENGILVAPGDEDALYNAMEAMIKNYSRYDRKKISQDAQAKYNPEVVGKQIVEVYEKVLAKK